MSYIIPNGDDKRYDVKAQPFTTQHGYSAIEFIGEEVPDSYNNGFKYYDNNDKLLADYSSYIYSYKSNAYAVEQDNIDYPKPANDPIVIATNTRDTLYKQVGELTERVEALTPYTETKTAYIDDTSITFTSDRQGLVLIDAITQSGSSIATINKREGNIITVEFAPLEEVTNITLTIQ